MSYYFDCYGDKEQNKEEYCCEGRNEQQNCCKNVVEETICCYPQPWDRKEEEKKCRDKKDKCCDDNKNQEHCEGPSKKESCGCYEEKKCCDQKKDCEEINLTWCEKPCKDDHKDKKDCDSRHGRDEDICNKKEEKHNNCHNERKEVNCRDKGCGCKRDRCNCCICNTNLLPISVLIQKLRTLHQCLWMRINSFNFIKIRPWQSR